MKIGENKIHPDENTIEINLNGDYNALDQKETSSYSKERQKINTTEQLFFLTGKLNFKDKIILNY